METLRLCSFYSLDTIRPIPALWGIEFLLVRPIHSTPLYQFLVVIIYIGLLFLPFLSLLRPPIPLHSTALKDSSIFLNNKFTKLWFFRFSKHIPFILFMLWIHQMSNNVSFNKGNLPFSIRFNRLIPFGMSPVGWSSLVYVFLKLSRMLGGWEYPFIYLICLKYLLSFLWKHSKFFGFGPWALHVRFIWSPCELQPLTLIRIRLYNKFQFQLEMKQR